VDRVASHDSTTGPGAAPNPSMNSRLFALRDRWLADPAIQKWLATFPLTRRFAAKEAQAVFDVCAGFVYSQVLLACVRLKLLESLQNGPKSRDEICSDLGLQPEAAAKLLKAAASLKLLSARGGDRWGLGTRGAAILGNPSIAAMVEHHALLYADLYDPVALLRGSAPNTHLSQYWTYAGGKDTSAVGSDDATTYSGLMTVTQDLVAGEVLDAYPMGQFKSLLDIGGGEGRFISAVAQCHAHLALAMFDLPPVADRARENLVKLGLGERISVSGGSFFTDPLPRGADLISLVRICFDHSDTSVLALLRAIRRIVPETGAVIIAEPVSGDAKLAPITDAYYGFYLLSMGGGKTRNIEEFRALAREAGFSRTAQLPTRRPLLTGLIELRP
jgi:demethylspheroidene O-methyltransferase